MCIYFIHSSVDGHLVGFRILAIVNNASVNIGVQVSFQISILFSLYIYPGVELQTHVIALSLGFFEKPPILFSTVAIPTYIPSNSTQEPLFPHPPHVVRVLVDDSHADRCEMISPCGFSLHFLFGKMCIQFFCPFVSWVVYFFGVTLYELFICAGY